MRGSRGGRGDRRGGRREDGLHEEREHGRWTQEKGDREAVKMVARMREGQGDGRSDGGGDDDVAEGMREFVELVRLRFGEKEGLGEQ